MLPLLFLASVLRVVDGDTLHVDQDGHDITVRVLGIDCPESRAARKCGHDSWGSCDHEKTLGKAAAVRARQLLPTGAAVSLEQADHHDRYGRTLAYVRLSDGRDYGLVMLKEGLCADYSARYPHPRSESYRAAKER